MKRFYFFSLLILVMGFISSISFSACSGDDDKVTVEVEDNPSIPKQRTYYRINMSGNTSSSNFVRSACLYVTPTIQTSANFNNGVNTREVGIISGFPAGNQEKGALWFFTNTSLCQYGSTGCNATIINAAIDVTFVEVDEADRTIEINLDGQIYNNTAAGPILTTNFLNHFTAQASLFATIYRVVTGKIELEFSEDGESVSGTIDIVGNNFSGSGFSVYKANFAGEKMAISAADCK